MADNSIRITPGWLWDLVLEFAGDRDTVDVCTQPDNPLGADRFFTAETDGLRTPWASDVRESVHWCNPPYSRGQVELWADKCIREARVGCEILLLTQADVSTGWYRLLRENADARCHLARRVCFLEPAEGGYRPCKGGAKFGTMVTYWGPRRRRFDRVFSPLGEVLHGLGPCEETEAAN